MSEVDIPLIVGILVTMVFSAFFSGMEIAFVSSNRMRAEMDKEKMPLSSHALEVFYSHPNNFVSTMLVGNNIALVVYGILIASLFDNTIFKGMDAAFTVPADTILSTIIVLFTGEFLPKSLFKSNPNRLLAIFAIPAFYAMSYSGPSRASAPGSRASSCASSASSWKRKMPTTPSPKSTSTIWCRQASTMLKTKKTSRTK